ncbi:hypothetical protein B0J11DRAFT_427786 [Dendryphion nanum]|uniref:Uncharacterized protein n=1 Tax=Dendryphion nanum TaxID=256645 RepID=A0A9P9E659_9PLEO|nr:hypothetical protein B0J11DRAFT_427786 [Dendryphion nanum]
MGRQPFLTRLAFGRSPFEPSTSATRSSEYVQLDSSQQDTPLEARAPNSNRYIQLFDERGDAVNPRAQQYGRQFRRAQNDVLSSIGFLARRRSSSEEFPGTYEERLLRLENEDSVGNTISRVTTMTANICTWWIGSLRDRILTFHIESALPFSKIIESEYQTTGASFFYTGFVANDISAIATDSVINATLLLRPVHRLLHATQATRKTKSLARRWSSIAKTFALTCIDVLFFPLVYYARAQRLGIFPARPAFPPWGALVPFSSASPLRALYSDEHQVMANKLHLLTALATSPVFLFCLEIMVIRLISPIVHDAIETSIICPNNPDMDSFDAIRQRLRSQPDHQRKSPLVLRRIVNKFMGILGWSEPKEVAGQRIFGEDSIDAQEIIDVGDGRVVNTSRLALATRTNADQERDMQLPDSPTESNASEDANDPRIRITARGGVVEMEVQLPPHTISSHTELIDLIPNDGYQALSTFSTGGTKAYHRVTQLSVGPAQRLSAIVEAHIVGWILLPLRLLTLHSIAAHYLADGHKDLHRPLITITSLFPNFPASTAPWNLRSFGVLASRVALCGTLELAIDLSLWAFQWMAVSWIGRNGFGWGTL